MLECLGMLSVYLGFGRTMLLPSVSLLRRTVWRVGFNCLQEALSHKHKQQILLNLLIIITSSILLLIIYYSNHSLTSTSSGDHRLHQLNISVDNCLQILCTFLVFLCFKYAGADILKFSFNMF